MEKLYKVSNIEDIYKIGIYKITCLKNNKVYIGSAASHKCKSKNKKGFYRRWKDHINKLNKNLHANKILQHSWNKYGEDSFTFEILEICEFKDIINKENFYINLYKNNLFNILKGHLANYNDFKKEHKLKILNSLKNKKRPLEVIKKWSKAVQQIDDNNNIINVYYSMSEAERQTGIMRQDIGQACIGKKMKKAGGYFWKLVKDIV